ncbi:DNA-processing protein DprA [Lachnospiraceae bacterium JLR.KK008]
MDCKEYCILKSDDRYPRLLRGIGSAPGKLYVRGQLPDDNIPSVAVIGARRCSSYGKEMARWFASALAEAGVQIISGMALGVDGIAQRAALSAGGRSFGVLGCGTNVCYPRANHDLYEALLRQGGILSEHPADTPPLARHFPSRNRIISALADVVLVVEAKERSGTLITVDFALEQGKDVYVLPGRITDTLSCGCNRLLRQGAGIALEPADILEAFYGKGRLPSTLQGMEQEEAATAQMSQKEKIVWNYLGNRPVTLQELYGEIREAEEGNVTELAEITDILMDFVLQGIVSQERGNQYRKRGKSDIADACHGNKIKTTCHSESFGL